MACDLLSRNGRGGDNCVIIRGADLRGDIVVGARGGFGDQIAVVNDILNVGASVNIVLFNIGYICPADVDLADLRRGIDILRRKELQADFKGKELAAEVCVSVVFGVNRLHTDP